MQAPWSYLLLIVGLVSMAGCIASEPGAPGPSDGSITPREDGSTDVPQAFLDLEDVNVTVEIWENWMPGSTSHNMTVFVKILAGDGEAMSEGVAAEGLLLESDEGVWETVPVLDESRGVWKARNGPTWPIGTLVQVALDMSSGNQTKTFVIPDVEVQAAY